MTQNKLISPNWLLIILLLLFIPTLKNLTGATKPTEVAEKKAISYFVTQTNRLANFINTNLFEHSTFEEKSTNKGKISSAIFVDGAAFINSVPSSIATFAIQPSYTNNSPNSDGYLQLSGVTDGDRVNFSTGNIYTGDTDYANAIAASGNLSDVVNIIVNSLDLVVTQTSCVDNTDGTFTANYDAVVNWNSVPFAAGDMINVTHDGVSIGMIDPSTDSSPSTFPVAIDANGNGTHAFKAEFTIADCADSLSFKTPTPCPDDVATCASTTGCIGGNVFEDFNCNGTDDTNEPGVQGIEVQIYDCNNALVGTGFSDTEGDWQVCSLTDGTAYRVEFILPESISCWATPTQVGSDNGSDIQFLTAPACTQFSVSSPADYCHDNPQFVTACFVEGDPDVNSGDVLVEVASNSGGNPSFPHQHTTTPFDNRIVALGAGGTANAGSLVSGTLSRYHLADNTQTGAVNYIAHDRISNNILSAAYMKRFAGFTSGPNNSALGTIWVTDRDANPNTTTAFYMANAGVDSHDYSDADLNSNVYHGDEAAANDVGYAGWGDIDISEDGNWLYAINLFDQKVYMIPIIRTGSSISAGTAVTIDYPATTCSNGEWVPGALKVYKGEVYTATTCTGYTSQDVLDLESCIYKFPVGITSPSWTSVLCFPMTYPRPINVHSGRERDHHWLAWRDLEDIPDASDVLGSTVYPQHQSPWLADIEFNHQGNMIIAIKDRTADQGGTLIPGEQEDGANSGDLLIAFKNGSGFTFEDLLTNPAAIPTDEFFVDDVASVTSTVGHRESFGSGIAFVPGTDNILSSGLQGGNIGAIQTFNTLTGVRSQYYGVYHGEVVPSFRKGGGLGDVEVLCAPSPLEIGNYVWCDTIKNGIQDACERGINNILVSLYDRNGVLVGQDTTSNSGQYYFNQNNVDTTGITVDGNGIATPVSSNFTGMNYSTQYFIVFGGGQFATDEFTVGSDTYGITSMANVGSNDNIDSDVDGSSLTAGSLGARPDGLPFIEMTTSATGCGDHKYDLGLTCPIPLSLGNLVWEDLNNNGLYETGEPGIDSVELILYAVGPDGEKDGGDDIEIAKDTTDIAGNYLFEDLLEGTYYVKINSGIPTNMVSSTGTGADGSGTSTYEPSTSTITDTNNDDDGTQMIAAGVLMIMSDTINLSENLEPTDDDDTDNNSNLSIDFGLIRLLSIGNLVWEDANNDGLNNNSETGLDGIEVMLLQTGADNTKGTADDVALDSMLTASGGLYLFDSLYPGEYYIKLNSDIPTGMISSTGEGTGIVITGSGTYEPAPDPDATDTNDDDNGTQMDTMVMSDLVQLSLSTEPITDGDTDTTSNLAVDFGLFQTLSIGNLVWEDLDNNGMADAGEPGIENVELILYAVGPDGEKDGGDDIEIATETTDINGNYLFDTLSIGTYYVKINSGILAGLVSSTGTGSDGTGNSDFEPGAMTNNDTDNNDDGTQMVPIAIGMIMSDTIQLVSNSEPTNDEDTDANTNTTIDFGLIPTLSLGNRVYLDLDNNGLNNSETGVDGVEMILFKSSNAIKGDADDVALDTVITAGGGLYRFDDLFPGDYFVKLNSGIPTGKVSSTGEGATLNTGSGSHEPSPDPDTDIDGDDNGTQMGTMIMSDLVSLTLGSTEPNDNDNTGYANFSVDFGLIDCPTIDLTITTPADSTICSTDGTTVNLTISTTLWDGQNIAAVYSTTVLANPYTDGSNSATTTIASGTATLDVALPANNTTSPIDYIIYTYLPNAVPDACQAYDSTLVTIHPMIDAGVDNNGLACNNNADGISEVNLAALVAATAATGGTYERADGRTEGAFDAVAGTFDATGIVLPAAQADTLDFYYIVNGATGSVGSCFADTALLQVVVVECCPVITISRVETNQDTLCSDEGKFDIIITHEMNPGEMALYYNTGPAATFDQIYSMVANGQMQQMINVTPTTTTDINTTVSMQMLPANTIADSLITYNIYTVLDSDNANIDADGSDGGVCLSMAVSQVVILPETATATVKDSTICTENSLYTTLIDNVINLNGLITSGSKTGTWTDDDATGGLVDSTFTADASMAGQTYNFTYTLAGTEATSTNCSDNTYTVQLTINRCFVDLGNLVWEDKNNDGTSTGETGIDGVEVIVYSTTNDAKGDSDDVAVDTITTTGGGAYLFENLVPGDYWVKLNSGIPVGYGSSTGEGADGTGNSDFEPAADPDANATNNDDNGTQMGTMVMSEIVSLVLNDEPTDDDDTDAYTNLSVDFGLYKKLSLGNLVWTDTNNNGMVDGGETGIDGVEVILFKSDNTTKGDGDDVAIDTITTANGGQYLFDNLNPGEYFVKLNSGLPVGLISSNGSGADGSGTITTEPATDPDATDANNDDNGTQMGPMIMSDLVTLHLDDEPINDDDIDANTNLAVDFGLIPSMSLGNMVWEDKNNDGIMDSGEPAIASIETILYKDGGDGQISSADDIEIARDTTDSFGKYLYEGLYPGDYFVKLNDGIPYNMTSSTGEGVNLVTGTGAYEPAPDVDTVVDDTDDNGNQMIIGNTIMIVSDLVTLNLYNEPINDEDTDENTNTTVDFGLIKKLDLGGLVWFDRSNDGINDTATEEPMEAIEVILFKPGTDGQVGTADDIEIDRVLTDAAGKYVFNCLFPNAYYVKLNNIPNEVASSDGNGFSNYRGNGSIEPATDPDNNIDGDDNGTQMGATMVVTEIIDLVLYDEPIDDDDTDNTTNTTVDFALTPLHYPHISNACNCLGNESTPGAGDGEFEETIQIYSSVLNETWTLVSNNGLYTTDSKLVALGSTLQQTGEENGLYLYTMLIRHIDSQGYRAVFSNGNSEIQLNNYCSYAASCRFEVVTSEDGTIGQPTIAAQTDFVIGVNTTAVCDSLTICDDESTFSDDGLVDGLYQDSTVRDDQFSICPQSKWQRLTYTFSEFGLASGDMLLVYDGKYITSPLIGQFTGEGVSQTGGWVAASCSPVVNPTGCLTFRFQTNGDNNKSIGWSGNIACSEREIELTGPNDLNAKLSCEDTYTTLAIKPADINAECGTVQDSQLVRIFNANGDLCIDTCLASTDVLTDTFGIGIYLVQYKLKSDTTKVTQSVLTVQGPSLVCNDRVNVPLGSGCSIALLPDDLLERPCDTITDTLYYFITLKGLDKNGNQVVLATGGGKGGAYPVLTKDMIDGCGTIITATIEKRYYDGLTLTFCNNGVQSTECSVEVEIKDQSVPVFVDFNAVDTLVNCSVDLTQEGLGLMTPTAIDNCGEPMVILQSIAVVSQGASSCEDNIVDVTWTATDDCGNTTNAIQRVVIIRPQLTNIVKTEKVILACDSEAGLGSVTTVPGLQIGRLVNGVLEVSDTIDLNTVTYTCGYILEKYDVEIPATDCGKKIFRYWSVLDWCDTSNGVIAIDTTFIEYKDTIAPQFEMGTGQNTVIALEHASCTYDINNVSKPTATDNCSIPSVYLAAVSRIENGENWLIESENWAKLDCDSFQLQWIASDDCHEQLMNDTIYQIIEVEDVTLPSAVCGDVINLSLGLKAAKLHYEDIDAGSYDACGIEKYEVSRDEVFWDSTVTFSCADIHQEVFVYLRVTDKKGNQNSCWMTVNVEDKIAPICSDLAAITLSCEETHLVSELATTDTDNNHKMDDIEWLDATTELISQFDNQFGNPNCSDNVVCEELSIEQQYQFITKSCGEAHLKRRFRATDWDNNGNTSSWAEQDIYFETKANWSITLPTDWEGACGDEVPDSEIIINNAACDLLGYEVDEKIFTVVEDACLKVVRTFTITNWCTYQAGTAPVRINRVENVQGLVTEEQVINAEGYENVSQLEYIQILKVSDQTAPVITIAAVDSCITGQTCSETKVFSASAQDCIQAANENLLFSWTLSADSIQIADGTGNVFEAIVEPKVAYEVKWTVQDNCGNTAWEIENYQFWDCKRPSPYCANGIVTSLMEGTAMIDVWATDLEHNSSDNCTAKEQLDFRIWHATLGAAPTDLASVQMLPKVITFSCLEVGNQTINLYAIDEEGNWDFCITYVLIQDNTQACNGIESTEEMALVSGVITDWKANNVENVLVKTDELHQMNTKADGQYQLELVMNEDYIIQPQKEEDPLNGVSTFDLVLISKHILGIESFGSPYQFIAADVNKSGTITAFDMVQLRQLILNIKTDFSNNTSWRFVEANHEFVGANPLTENFSEVGQIIDLHQDMLMNFVAVKVGDVNGSAKPNSLVQAEDRTTDKVFEIIVADKDLKVGEAYTVMFSTKQLEQIQGYQFTLGYDDLRLEKLHSGLAGIENFGLHKMDKGMITTSWNKSTVGSSQLAVNSTQPTTDNPQLTTLFSIDFKALYAGKLSEQLSVLNRPTTIEAYDENGDLMEVQLTFTTPLIKDEFELFQNQPNPFHDKTMIGFYLPGDSEVQLILRDETGRLLRTLTEDGKAGYNTIQLDKEGLTNGFIYYQLSTKFGAQAKKMLKLK